MATHEAVALIDDVEDARGVGMAGTLGLGLEDSIDEVVLPIGAPGLHLQVAADLAELRDTHLQEIGHVEVIALARGLEFLHFVEFADGRATNRVATSRATVAWTLIWAGHREGATCVCKGGPIDRAGKGPRRGRVGNGRSMDPLPYLVNLVYSFTDGAFLRSYERLTLICVDGYRLDDDDCAGPHSLIATGDAIKPARNSDVAAVVRAARLVIVLRRVAPQARLLELVAELAGAGARLFEITFDGETAAADIAAVEALFVARAGVDRRRCWVGAGTIRTIDQVQRAAEAGAAFGVSPIFDPVVLDAAHAVGLPFVPGAYSPTEIDAAWRAGAAFVKLFPGSSLGPSHVRELRGPMPEIEMIVTGGIDATNAPAFLAAGATAVGIGSAVVRADAAARAALIGAIAAAGEAGGPG